MSIPSVSVVITSFNRAELLREAIQSVLDQSYQDFEIILVDDGSEDHSLEIIEAFRSKEPQRIRFYTHEKKLNKGIQETHQLGISKARGEFVAFLDNDDHWSENYLESKVKLLRTHPDVGVVFSPYKVFGDGWFGRDMMLRQWLLRPSVKKGQPFDNFGNLLQFNNVATFSCFVTRKALLDTLSSPSEETLLYDWWVLMQLSTQSLYYCDTNSLTYWRWSKQSTMGQQPFEGLKDLACRHMEQMYYQIDKDVERLSVARRQVYEKYRVIFPFFLSYYRKPGFMSLARFFRLSPSWASASVLSLIINYFKFR